jgi:hypothetical protein
MLTESDMRIQRLPEIGQRVRFAIKYGGAWRPLGWVRAGKDGSIYVGILTGKPTTAKVADKPADKITDVRYSDLTESDEVPKSSRLSFHPSGEVHIGGKVVTGLVPLAELRRPLLLCLMLFAHPGRYKSPGRKGPGDYDLGIEGYLVDDERPMYGAIVVAPWNTRPQLPEKLPRMTQSVVVAVGLRGFAKTPDLIIEIILGHGPKGPWPGLPAVNALHR